jgi:hypothetical protein
MRRKKEACREKSAGQRGEDSNHFRSSATLILPISIIPPETGYGIELEKAGIAVAWNTPEKNFAIAREAASCIITL